MSSVSLSQNLNRLGIKIASKSITKSVLAKKHLLNTVQKALRLPLKKRVSKASKVRRMFGAPNILYTNKGGVRKNFEKAFMARVPKANRPRYNQARNRVVNGANAERALMNSRNKGIISAMLMPVGPGVKGGVRPGFFNGALKENPIRYAFVRKAKNGSNKVRGFALLHDKNRNTRYLELLAGEGYGGRLIDKAVANAIMNGKTALTLSAVKDPKLRNYYKKRGFVYNNGALAHYRNKGLPTQANGKNFEYYNNSWLMPMRLNISKKFAYP
jgi:hypothetical protein